MKWITREKVKVDRVACPWLITRFIDNSPQFVLLPTDTDWLAIGDGILRNASDSYQTSVVPVPRLPNRYRDRGCKSADVQHQRGRTRREARGQSYVDLHGARDESRRRAGIKDARGLATHRH